MFKTRLPEGKTLPLVVEADDDQLDRDSRARLFVDRRDELREKLLECDALLLRAARAMTPAEFARFVREF